MGLRASGVDGIILKKFGSNYQPCLFSGEKSAGEVEVHHRDAEDAEGAQSNSSLRVTSASSVSLW
jgi:hypothetical protein